MKVGRKTTRQMAEHKLTGGYGTSPYPSWGQTTIKLNPGGPSEEQMETILRYYSVEGWYGMVLTGAQVTQGMWERACAMGEERRTPNDIPVSGILAIVRGERR